MAHKLNKPKPVAAAEPTSSAAEDLQALQPDAQLVIAGRRITIREYGLWEGLRVAARAKELVADMFDIAAAGELTYLRVRELLGKHHEVVIEIAALAADVEPEWVAALKGAEGELFLSTWMVVNGPFFAREFAALVQVARVQRAMGSRSSDSSSDLPVQGSAISID